MKPIVAALTVASVTAFTSLAQGVGPDVIVGDLTAPTNYGSIGGIAAFALGTTSCNVGSQPMPWEAATNHHPAISQSLFRILNGRFEQVGMSWVKHGFGSSTGNLCGTCQNPNNSQIMGVGCSDPYGSGTNGNQPILGPRSQVNPTTGVFPYPFSAPPFATIIDRRLQVHESDLDPAVNAGAVYIAEGQYVTPDDATAGNTANNASWRPCTVGGTAGNYTLALTGSTVQQHAAIEAWAAYDPLVTIQYVDVPDGRFIVGRKVTTWSPGVQTVVYAVHNLNSERACQEFHVDLTPGTQVFGAYFHDVDYHSGETISGTDWTPTITSSSISWAGETWLQNQTANAIRWGTTYTFAFIAVGGAPTGFTLIPYKPYSCPPPPVVPTATVYTQNPSVPFDHVVLTGVGQPGPTGDDIGMVVTLPGGLALPFFDMTLTQIGISTNGYLYMPSTAGNLWQNVAIPTSGAPDGFIAGYWDDLHVGAPPGSGSITWGVVGQPPNRRFAVQWSGVYRFGTTNPESFEIIVDETTGTVSTTILQTTDGGASATRGIESPSGNSGILTSFNAPGSAAPLTTTRYVRQALVPQSANLTLAGHGTANSTFGATILSSKVGGLVLLLAGTQPGPTSLGALGTINVSLGAPFAPLADGPGVFSSPNPSAATDGCGLYTFTYTFGPTGLPSGTTLYFQGFVLDTSAPNGAFHISQDRVLNVP